ncbi:phosphotransferase family protein [Mesorhizobium koreense]|uniref:phosphotransferase family protein n=1 Tax=Mesorhizobium koreense TaxID=3074855 RepID=UPI00287B7B84|nr:aminoglycoside phosphotransferase family protein [Mesorhizobium sp. WR6]
MPDEMDQRCTALVEELGIARPDKIIAVKPLSGGVASDIAVVSLVDRDICVKFALPRLKVAEDWRAPVHRNRAEYAWLSFAGTVAPKSVPRLLGISASLHGFAMEYLAGTDIYLWKTALLKEAPGRREAERVGDVLGRIHAASTRLDFDRSPFFNRDDFRSLRLEPYLAFTAGKHPDLASRLIALAERLYASEIALVHGDVSPKNILFCGADPILLDAECATMGDPCFDVAFCLNHLILKSVHLPASRDRLLGSVGRFWAAYSSHIAWEEPQAMEERVAALLPALMLARVDGKSPVEYLSEASRATVRALAVPLISHPVATLGELVTTLKAELNDVENRVR